MTRIPFVITVVNKPLSLRKAISSGVLWIKGGLVLCCEDDEGRDDDCVGLLGRELEDGDVKLGRVGIRRSLSLSS